MASFRNLEHTELLADVGQTVGLLHLVLNHVESHRLGEGSTRHTPTPRQTCTDRWSQHHPPSRRSKESSEQGCYDVSSRNYVISPSQRTSLPSVLLHVSQVVTTHDDGALHLRGDDQTLQDGSTDRHGGSERALLVDVLAANGHLGRLDAQTDISVPTLIGLLAEDVHLAVGELVLLLVGSLVLQIRVKRRIPCSNTRQSEPANSRSSFYVRFKHLLVPECQPLSLEKKR